MIRPPDPPLRDGDLLLRTGRASDVAAIREVYSDPGRDTVDSIVYARLPGDPGSKLSQA